MTDRWESKLHEECGVFGIYSPDGADVVSACYHGLYALQHRGQESCGIAVNNQGVISCHKDLGLVSSVFTREVLEAMGPGQIGVGHCRYATTGSQVVENAQPLLIRHRKGNMALAHNGNLTNAGELRREYELDGTIFYGTSDTEVIAHTITRQRLVSASIEEAVEKAMQKLKGAYSLVITSPRKLIAARDPMGFRPLCIGKLGESIVFASESCALDAVGARFVRDIEPGEIVVADDRGITSIRTHCGKKGSLCIFEFIYFARPDSVIDGCSVHQARLRAGELLARRHPVDADVVIGVPDSGLDAALGYARESGIPYGVGFIKNRYVGRTFIVPGQEQRENAVRIKLNPVSETVQGKRVVLIDDSIVRGTTSQKIVKLLRDAGAAEVHMRLSSPPFLYPCYFGVDVDSSENLIAYTHTLEEIREIIGADSLGYLGIDDLVHLVPECPYGICDACFTGNYPVDPPSVGNKDQFER